MIVTRFAPSPTGDLHLGGALVALASYWLARTHDGRCALRIEDLDVPRVVLGSSERIVDDLSWMGLNFDDMVRQSERTAAYEAAISRLGKEVYPCDCSRSEIARVASAPHEGEEIVYPGTCRDKDPAREMRRPAALRLRVPSRTMSFIDRVKGPVTSDLEEAGDFVLRRGDGAFAYQLAVVVDDLACGATDVVRGDDLLASTGRQLYLAERLGGVAPRYHHLPLVRDEHGARIAKRTRGASVRAIRNARIPKDVLLGELAAALGILDRPMPTSLEALLGVRDRALSPRPFVVPEAFRALPSEM